MGFPRGGRTWRRRRGRSSRDLAVWARRGSAHHREALKQWAEARLEELREAGHRKARQAVAELCKQHRPVKRKALRKLAGYLTNNAKRMDYPRDRREGLPVGSGAVESMCKTLVGTRCKQAGMRNWTRRGAEAVLRLRAAQSDGDFGPLWDAHLRLAS